MIWSISLSSIDPVNFRENHVISVILELSYSRTADGSLNLIRLTRQVALWQRSKNEVRVSLCWRCDRFWLAFARSWKIKRSLIVNFFLNADFILIADSFLTANFFLTADLLTVNTFASKIFCSRSLFFMQTWELSSKIKIFDYSKKHYWITNSKNFVCCSKKLFVQKNAW
jgi:hypothetical protein